MADAALFSPAWCWQHVPLIEAPADLANASHDELRRRMQLVADHDGRTMVEALAARLDRHGDEIAAVADTLSLTAERIKEVLP